MNVQLCQEIINQNKESLNFFLLDVRTEDEYAHEHIDGSINFNCYAEDFKERIEQLEKDKEYVVYCEHDPRSQQVLKVMDDLGFTDVVYMEGGITAWKQEGFEVVK